MKFSFANSLCLGLSTLQLVSARYAMYFDQYHVTDLPPRNVTAGIDTVIMAFVNSSLFTTDPPGNYTPFLPLPTVKAMFDPGTKFMFAVGGWGDTVGFTEAMKTEASRALFAKGVKMLIDQYGFDGMDCDLEYPGGNGADYIQVPNSQKTDQIDTFPLLLAAIREAIGPNKLLSIAAPGLRRDMIAYTPEKAPSIWKSLDFVNIMTYDLMNRRDTVTTHQASVKGAMEAVDYYLGPLGLPPSKAVLGFPFYAKWFMVANATNCTTGLGCKTVLLEDVNGTDTGFSGAITFEKANYGPAPTNLTQSLDGSCGGKYKCGEGLCCSASNFCGTSSLHCGLNCNADFGTCKGSSITTLFRTAMKSGITDEEAGGQYYFDKSSMVFWTWDTPALIGRKFIEIVKAKNLGGVMAWSLGEDSYDYSHILALQRGAKMMGWVNGNVTKSAGGGPPSEGPPVVKDSSEKSAGAVAKGSSQKGCQKSGWSTVGFTEDGFLDCK